MTFHPDQLPDLKGKVFVVTGGNGGIGYHTVSHLAAQGAHVYLCSRSADNGNKAIASIHQEHPAAKVTLLEMDLTNLASVKAAAQRFLSLETSLHGLVNNAGIMATPFEMTRDNHEKQWQTNYLSHWLLTHHLLPLLRATAKTLPPGSVRIVNLSSSGHNVAPKGGINFEDTTIKDGSVWMRYGQSKVANILHTRTLHARYGPGSDAAKRGEGEIWTVAIHPGLVQTGLARDAKGMGVFKVIAGALGLFWTPERGSWNSLYCVAGPMKKEESGDYLEIYKRFGEPRSESAAAKDGKLAERLEEWTEELMRREGWIE